jgi:hypothetical protein
MLKRDIGSVKKKEELKRERERVLFVCIYSELVPKSICFREREPLPGCRAERRRRVDRINRARPGVKMACCDAPGFHPLGRTRSGSCRAHLPLPLSYALQFDALHRQLRHMLSCLLQLPHFQR